MRDREVLAKKRVPVGVRNTAIDGDNRALAEGIRETILQLTRENPFHEGPQIVIAAGMITSNLGLHEVKHIQAPAGLFELASNIQEKRFEDLKDVAFYFIPGVRSAALTLRTWTPSTSCEVRRRK
jgi:2-dehydro-3-deoxygalactonokinase